MRGKRARYLREQSRLIYNGPSVKKGVGPWFKRLVSDQGEPEQYVKYQIQRSWTGVRRAYRVLKQAWRRGEI